MPVKSYRQAQKTKRARQPKSPYPHRGSPTGDVLVGTCAWCGEEIQRGDAFMVNITDVLVHTGACLESFATRPKAPEPEPELPGFAVFDELPF